MERLIDFSEKYLGRAITGKILSYYIRIYWFIQERREK